MLHLCSHRGGGPSLDYGRLVVPLLDAADAGVTGTPTIFVNGKQVAAYDWVTLQPFLKDAGG